METVNERGTLIVTVAFKDEDDIAITPTSATYRIDDVGSGTAILASTALTGLGTTKSIEVTPAQNRILTETNAYEWRRMTVTYNWGTAKSYPVEYVWKIKNLFGVTTPAP